MAAVLSHLHHKDGTLTTQGVWTSENTLANFEIRGCETLSLYIKIFMYMQVGRLSGCNLKRPPKSQIPKFKK
jgi:hypothetical protein